VAIASFQGFVDSVLLGIFVLPGAEADSGDLSTSVKLELCICVCHSSDLGGRELSRNL